MDASFWATVALVIFLAGMVYLKVPGLIGSKLDERAEKISSDLEEARRLREEAQELLAEYQRKRKEAEKEAEEIVSAAKREAEALAVDAARKTEDFVKRRTAVAEQKIQQAESQAIADVRASAVDIAVAAAEQVVMEKASGAAGSSLIASSIAEVKARLN